MKIQEKETRKLGQTHHQRRKVAPQRGKEASTRNYIDANAGLELCGRALSFQRGASYGNPSSLYSASHILGRFERGGIAQAPNAFPALPTPASGPDAAAAPDPVAAQQPPKTSKTLSRMTKTVKKRDLEEL